MNKSQKICIQHLPSFMFSELHSRNNQHCSSSVLRNINSHTLAMAKSNKPGAKAIIFRVIDLGSGKFEKELTYKPRVLHTSHSGGTHLTHSRSGF
jgi:hypothetical protein